MITFKDAAFRTFTDNALAREDDLASTGATTSLPVELIPESILSSLRYYCSSSCHRYYSIPGKLSKLSKNEFFTCSCYMFSPKSCDACEIID